LHPLAGRESIAEGRFSSQVRAADRSTEVGDFLFVAAVGEPPQPLEVKVGVRGAADQ
jgi:hypothetical protein